MHIYRDIHECNDKCYYCLCNRCGRDECKSLHCESCEGGRVGSNEVCRKFLSPPKPVEPTADSVCVDCGSADVHSIEFRTDYTFARNISAVNEGFEDIINDDLPLRLEGYYCHSCESFCSIRKNKVEEGDLDVDK